MGENNLGKLYITSADFMKMSPVVRLCSHATKQFFPQETWRETASSFPVQKVNDEVWGDTQLSERDRMEALSDAINQAIEHTAEVKKTCEIQEVLRVRQSHYSEWVARVRRVHGSLPREVREKWRVRYEVVNFLSDLSPLMTMAVQDEMGKRIMEKLYKETKKWEYDYATNKPTT